MTALRAELIAIFLVLGGCVCNDGVCSAVTSSTPPETKIFATAGAAVTAKVVLPISCGVRVPTSTNVSVLDPSGDPMQVTAGEPRSVSGSGFEVDLTFTPTFPGAYHLTARFEPNFGVGQLDVIVAAEMRDAGSITVTRPCARGDFSPSGLVLCTNAGTVDVLSGSTLVQSFTGLTARAGRTLWVSDGGTVERWVEDGGAYALVASARAPSAHVTISATEDEALFVTSPPVSLQLWVDGGIIGVAAPPIPTNNAVWRGDGQIVTVSGSSMSNLCVSRVPGFADGGSRCSTLTGPTVVAYGPDGIWVANLTATNDEVLRVDDTGPSGFALPTGWTATGLGRVAWDTGVLVEADAGTRAPGPLVVRPAGNDLVLENYGMRPRAITQSCVTLPSAGTDTRLIRR